MADAVEWIDPHDAKAMLDRDEAIVVDVREPAEIAASGIVPGALTIPVGTFVGAADPSSADHNPALVPDKTVIVYCASGKRSAFAGERLIDLGYRKVFNLGGLKDWAEAGLPVDNAS